MHIDERYRLSFLSFRWLAKTPLYEFTHVSSLHPCNSLSPYSQHWYFFSVAGCLTVDSICLTYSFALQLCNQASVAWDLGLVKHFVFSYSAKVSHLNLAVKCCMGKMAFCWVLKMWFWSYLERNLMLSNDSKVYHSPKVFSLCDKQTDFINCINI